MSAERRVEMVMRALAGGKPAGLCAVAFGLLFVLLPS